MSLLSITVFSFYVFRKFRRINGDFHFQNSGRQPSWNFKVHFFLDRVKNFNNPKILLANGVSRAESPGCIAVLNFTKIGQSVVEISRFFDFSRWRPPALVWGVLEPFTKSIGLDGGLYCCVNLVAIKCNGFDNMQASIFRALVLKTPSHAQKLDFWEIWNAVSMYDKKPS